jgi:predicted nucleic acid-binding protein
VILVDTGALLANYDRSDPDHADCARALANDDVRILSPFVLAELDYLVRRDLGKQAELEVLGDAAGGAYELAAFGADDVSAAIDEIERYADVDLGIADASILVLARRYECFDLLTLDRRHFRAVSGQDRVLRLLPDDSGPARHDRG